MRVKKLVAVLTLVVGLAVLLQTVVLPKFGVDFATVLPAVVALLTNNARAADNVAGLVTNEELTAAAQAKASDMAAKGYFAHVSPDGSLPWDWIAKAGYKYLYAGENLAVNFDDSSDVVNAWLASPSHRFNILRPQYTDIGIATATGIYKGKLATFTVEMFGSPALK